MPSLLHACRRCGAPIDVGARARLLPTPSRSILLDCACPGCGHRALYPAA